MDPAWLFSCHRYRYRPIATGELSMVAAKCSSATRTRTAKAEGEGVVGNSAELG